MDPDSRGHARALVRALVAAGCVFLGNGCTTQQPTAPAKASNVDPNRDEVKHVITALSVDAPDLDRRFSEAMRNLVPKLRLGWRAQVAENGPLESFAIVALDHDYGKQRYTVELDFERRTLNALVVLEPANGEVIGFFFSNHARPQPTVTPAAADRGADPDVDELALTLSASSEPVGASLTVPRRRGDARLPAVLLVPGSGPQDRDETMQGIKPFRDIARGLSRRDIVVLRFDKRAFTYPKRPPHATVEDEFVADALTALTVLRTRPEVDPKCVFVLGHSLGALLAPEIAQRGGDVAGLVLVAAPGRPVLDLTLEQFRINGVRASELVPLERQIKALPTLPPDERILGMPASYWQDLERRDEIAIARRLATKILYLRGSLDRNVFALDQEKWARAFAGDARFEAITIPRLSHALVPAAPDLTSDSHVPDALIARIADFVRAPATTPAP